MRKYLSLSIIIVVLGSLNVFSQTLADSIYQQNQRILKILESSSVSTQIFLGFRYYEEENKNYNEFTIKRGYITFQKSLNNHISGRITPDLTVDQEGDGMGDLEMRLKYCYMELKDDEEYGIFSNPKLLVGEVFTPWIEFEEKINEYRVIGSHFMDKTAILSSADFGIVTTALLGGKVNESYQKQVSKAYPGKYGSIALGIFNGGGYHALENNNNKTFQWRLSIRPLPEMMTGLQLSYTGVIGKGNTKLYPDWKLHAGIVSYEDNLCTLTGQYFKGKGNHTGEFADSTGKSYNVYGYSTFAELKLIHNKVSIFGRYDYMNTDELTQKVESTQEVIGIAYHIYGKNKIVLDFNRNKVDGESKGVFEVMVELAL
ncbi:hypothetical protein CYCD_03000 [Tenuifilaceae bacterium CYCD]|nr:hypothetical protein CYCD_03000 [Tenuifilaceae bacterium CYCD]